MSQSNNEEHIERTVKNKSNHPTRNMIIFLILFAVICIGITAFLIIISNKAPNTTENSNNTGNLQTNAENDTNINSEVEDDCLGLKSLNETYKENALQIKKVKFTDGQKDSNGQYKLQGSYVQIDGLNNKDLQQKINDRIKNEVKNSYNLDNLKENTTINANCTANFGNVLSIQINTYGGMDKKDGINIDLATGNDIKFKELFTNNATIKNILSKSIYDSLIMEATGNAVSGMNDNPDFSKNEENSSFYYENQSDINKRMEEYSKIEDKVFKIISYYNNGSELDFSFSPRCIYVYKDGSNIQIPMKKYYDQIAIYNRFKENSNIYDGKFENQDVIDNKKVPVFVSTNDVNVKTDANTGTDPISIDYVNVQQVSDNLLYNVVLINSCTEEDREHIIQRLSESFLPIINKKIEEYKQYNGDNVIYIEVKPSMDFDGNLLYIYLEEYAINSSYKKDFFEPIIGALQDGQYEIYWDSRYDEDIYNYIWKDKIKDYRKISNKCYIYDGNTKKWTEDKIEVNGQQSDNQNENEQSNTEEENEQNNEEQNNQQNSEKQSQGKVIVIDPGHQKNGNSEKEPIGPGATQTKAKVTTGATGVTTGQTESELNLKVSLLLQQELTKRGYKVIMTRTTNDVNISNSERAQIANNTNADAFIRIHSNSAENQSAKGVLTMCQTSSNVYNGYLADKSYKLSKAIVDNISKTTGTNNRGVTKTDDMSGINWCTVPTTIVEMGFLSNPEEDKLLADEAYQKKIVTGIINGLEQYLSN